MDENIPIPSVPPPDAPKPTCVPAPAEPVAAADPVVPSEPPVVPIDGTLDPAFPAGKTAPAHGVTERAKMVRRPDIDLIR